MKKIQPVTKERLRKFYANRFAGCTTVDEIADRAKEIAKKMYPNGDIDFKGKLALTESIEDYGKYYGIDEDVIIDATFKCLLL